MDTSEKKEASPADITPVNIVTGSADLTAEKVITVDHDEALDIFEGDANAFEYTEKEARAVRWKIDLIMMPMLTVTYMLNFLDKGQLSNASVFGLLPDLNLVGQDYSWTASIFYFGFLVWQYPSSIFMQKLPIGRWLGAMVFLWGISVAATAGATNFAGLATARFFLGVFESTNQPVFTILIGQYYTRQEQPLRACIWWGSAGIAGFIGDGVAYGIGHVNGELAVWKYLFLLYGPITILWGVFLFFALPNTPMTAWFLNERERKIAVIRVIKNHTGIENRTYKVNQVWECLLDPQAWLIFSISVLQCIPGGGLSGFNKLILTGLGYTNLQATIWSMPEHAIQLVSVMLAGIAGTYIKNSRCISMILSNVCCMIGAILVNALPVSQKLPRLGAVYALFTNTVSLIMCLSLISSNFAGFTKKTTVSVMVFVGYCVGQIITPQFFISTESPSFPTGFRAFYASMALMIAAEIALMLYYIIENRRRDRVAPEFDSQEVSDTDFLDLTDRQQPGFRYLW